MKGNSIRGFGRSDDSRRWRPAVRGGNDGERASARRKWGEKRLTDRGGSLPHGEASRARGQRRGAAERLRDGRSRHSGGGGASSRAARVLGDGGCGLRRKTLGHGRYL
jgi:hypothetical protein